MQLDLSPSLHLLSLPPADIDLSSVVYFLVASDQCRYVGQSVRPLERIRSHAALGRVFDAVYVLPVADEALADAERFWIRLLKPDWNITNTGRKVSSRGGRRANAGRKPSGLPPARTVSAALPEPLADRLDAWIAAHPADARPSRSAAIAQLLAAALDAALDAIDQHGARSQPPASPPSLPALAASPPSPPSLPPL